MSAVAGVFVRGGGPVPRGVVAHISGRQREMGPDAERFAWSGPVGMAHRVLHTEAGPRPHPFAQREGSLACMEGRVDNAGELTAALGGEGRGRAAAEVALAAYLQWGVEGLARLVGDFALALWDAPAGRLLLATDGMGRRPLYYRLTPESVCWASKSRPLAEALGLPPEPDDEFVAAFLANRPSAAGPIRGTAQLPGGHILVVERGRSELARYWSIDPDRRIEHRTDGEYEEHFREVFDQAVACRIQTDAPVFCELSGGLDSSTILSSADRLLKDGRAAAPSIHTVSYTFDQSSSSDERLYVRLMEEHVGRAGIHLSENDCPLLAPLPGEFLPDHPATELCFLERQDRVTREMQAAGSRVLLCGIGGDQAFWSTPPAALPLADLAARGRVVETLWRAGEWSRALRWPYLKTLWVGAVWPNLPRRWQARAQRQNPVGEWLAPEFVARMDLRERALSMSDDVGYCLPSASRQYGLFRQTMRTYALEWFSSEGYVDMRFPYLDRRLVEFALEIPLEQKVRPGETRSIVRRAFRGALPEPVRVRRGKAGPTEALHRALIREWGWLEPVLSDPLCGARGYVDRQAFSTALVRARHGLVSNSTQLLRTISLELWLRTLTPRSRPALEGDARDVRLAATP